MIFMLRRRPFTEAESADDHGAWTRGHARDRARPVAEGRPTATCSRAARRWTSTSDEAPRARARSPTTGRSSSRARSRGACRRAMMVAFVQVLLPLRRCCACVLLAGTAARTAAPAPTAPRSSYFACLGVGFIAGGAGALQHLTLLLGHPIFTLSVLLFTLLAAGGLGAGLSGRFRIRRSCCGVVAAAGVVYALALPRLVPALLPLPLAGAHRDRGRDRGAARASRWACRSRSGLRRRGRRRAAGRRRSTGASTACCRWSGSIGTVLIAVNARVPGGDAGGRGCATCARRWPAASCSPRDGRSWSPAA